MNKELKGIFKDRLEIIRNNEKAYIDTAHMIYKGNNEEYVTWHIISNIPTLVGNDKVLYSTYQVDIDIYSKGNYLDIENKIKKMMNDNDFVWVEDSAEQFEDDTKFYHKTITFEKERIN